MTPLDVTVATFLLEEVYVTFSWEVNGVITGFTVYFLPLARVIFPATPLIFVVLTVPFCTVTVTFLEKPLFKVMVSVALPDCKMPDLSA